MSNQAGWSYGSNPGYDPQACYYDAGDPVSLCGKSSSTLGPCINDPDDPTEAAAMHGNCHECVELFTGSAPDHALRQAKVRRHARIAARKSSKGASHGLR